MKCFKCEKEVNNIYPIIDNFQKVRFGLCPKCIGLLKKNTIFYQLRDSDLTFDIGYVKKRYFIFEKYNF